MVSQTIIFVFSILKIVLKSGSQTCKIQKLLFENQFKVQFVENCFYTVLKTKTKIIRQIRPNIFGIKKKSLNDRMFINQCILFGFFKIRFVRIYFILFFKIFGAKLSPKIHIGGFFILFYFKIFIWIKFFSNGKTIQVYYLNKLCNSLKGLYD